MTFAGEASPIKAMRQSTDHHYRRSTVVRPYRFVQVLSGVRGFLWGLLGVQLGCHPAIGVRARGGVRSGRNHSRFMPRCVPRACRPEWRDGHHGRLQAKALAFREPFGVQHAGRGIGKLAVRRGQFSTGRVGDEFGSAFGNARNHGSARSMRRRCTADRHGW